MPNLEINLLFYASDSASFGQFDNLLKGQVVTKHVIEILKSKSGKNKMCKRFQLGSGWKNLKRGIVLRRKSVLQECFLNYTRK